MFAKWILTHVVDIILDISALPTAHNACSTWGAWVAGRLGSAGGHPSSKPTQPPTLLQLTVLGARRGVLGPGEGPAGVADPVQPSQRLAAIAAVFDVSEDVHAHLAAHLLVPCTMREASELCGYTGNAAAQGRRSTGEKLHIGIMPDNKALFPPLTACACASGLGWSHCRRRLGRSGGVGSCGWFGSGSCDWLGRDRRVGSCGRALGQQPVPHACGREAAHWRADRSMSGRRSNEWSRGSTGWSPVQGGEPAIPPILAGAMPHCPCLRLPEKRHCRPHYPKAPGDGLTCAWHALVMQLTLVLKLVAVPQRQKAAQGCTAWTWQGE